MNSLISENLIANTSGVILMGGKGSRMGYVDKSKLMFDDRTFLSLGLESLSLFKQIFVSTKKSYNTANLGLPIIYDVIDVGPLGALYSILLSSNSKYVFVRSCDTPFIDKELVKFIINNHKHDSLATIPILNGQLEPLCALYSKNLSTLFKKSIDMNSYSIKNCLSNLNINYLNVTDTIHKDKFLNINNPSDYLNLNKKIPTNIC